MTSDGPARYVPDTNVCLDLFVFQDPRCASLLAAVCNGEIVLVTRDDCRAEWRAVLTYPQLNLSAERRERASRLFDAHVCCLAAGECEESSALLPRCRDPDDQKFLQLAQQCGAVAVLTRDHELLRLARRCKRDGLFAILPPPLWQEAIKRR